jgi:hypothetical protein
MEWTGEHIRVAYAERRAARQAVADRLTRWADLIAYGRLTVALVFVWLLALAAAGRVGNAWPLIPLCVFVGLVAWHRRVQLDEARAFRRVELYTRGLERLDEAWMGKGVRGEEFADGRHPFALDLDLFGTSSLYELLCVCRTRMGETRLAEWMCDDADRAEVVRRQEAAAELATAMDLREELWVAGDEARSEIDGATIRAWATEPPAMRGRGLRGLVTGLGVLAVAAVVLWGTEGRWIPLVIVGLMHAPVQRWLRGRTHHILETVDAPVRALVLVDAMLSRLRMTPVSSGLLRELVTSIETDMGPAIARLRRLVDLADSRENLIFAPIAYAILWPTQMALSIEAWRRAHGPAVTRWLDGLATLEALVAVGTYTAEHPEDVVPEVVAEGTVFEGRGIGHPLVPRARCVRNDVALNDATRVLLVSGSNMSGKSTLLRTVGLAVVLTRLGAPVRATALRVGSLGLGASIRIVDSLQEGASRFYAEITRIRDIVALASQGRPVLFLLDEVLHGTNSHDRLIGAAAIIRGLIARGAIGLVTTHDLALTSLADDPMLKVRNVHFADRFEDGAMVFDYRMHEGVVAHSNALALMRSIGLEV